ncbi:MAG: hypothetical protein H7A46_05885 [Verrucomicrobiales bacterium]|nr:hypothetical protein [Verrucomicrobiales bacterium]
MTTSKLDKSGVLGPAPTGSNETRLVLPADRVAFRSNGIEFLSSRPVDQWKEVTVELLSPVDNRPLQGTGVVVDCTGNRHTGYVVSLMFLSIAPDSRRRLQELSQSPMA